TLATIPVAAAQRQAVRHSEGIMRLGIYGGSFDPVHYGHLLLAETCREQCSLDRVIFMPAAVSPHKQYQVAAEADARCEMLNLAIAGHESFEVSRLEVDRGGVSYTVETLRALKSEDPQRELFLLFGADALADLPTWKEPDVICELCLPVVVARPGAAEVDFEPLREFASGERVELMKSLRVEMPQIDISSSEIRRRVANGRSIRYQTPRAVEKYIETHGVYRG
ncbi:unnamed protein product, partial [marine sediment metagenome]